MEKVRLGDICKIVSGGTPKTSVNEYWDGELDWVTPAEIDADTYILQKSIRKITKLGAESAGLRAFPKGTILLSSRAPIGKVAIAGKEMYCNQGFKNLICGRELQPEYLYWYLKGHTDYLNSLGRGATFKEISKSVVENIEIKLPDHDKQAEYAATVKRCWDLMALKRQQFQCLETLVKARFVEMFGDPMDKTKANTVFTNAVEFNPKKSEVFDKQNLEVSFVPMDHIGKDGSFKEERKGKISEFYKGYTYFKDGDVLMAKITPCFENGKLAIAKSCTNGIGFGTTEFHVVRPINNVSTAEWIQYLLKNDNLHEYAASKMSGSAGQKRIQTPFFKKLRVYLPQIEAQLSFSDFVQQIDKSKVAIQKSLDTVIFKIKIFERKKKHAY